jgi:hypothetical protein
MIRYILSTTLLFFNYYRPIDMKKLNIKYNDYFIEKITGNIIPIEVNNTDYIPISYNHNCNNINNNYILPLSLSGTNLSLNVIPNFHNYSSIEKDIKKELFYFYNLKKPIKPNMIQYYKFDRYAKIIINIKYGKDICNPYKYSYKLIFPHKSIKYIVRTDFINFKKIIEKEYSFLNYFILSLIYCIIFIYIFYYCIKICVICCYSVRRFEIEVIDD